MDPFLAANLEKQTPRLCKNCRLFEWHRLTCSAPQNSLTGTFSYVFGGELRENRTAEDCRRNETACGIEARWFLPLWTPEQWQSSQQPKKEKFDVGQL